MNYRQSRDYENLQKAMFPGVGYYDFPLLKPAHEIPDCEWIGFNFVRGCEEPEMHGVHFFVDDYQFVRVWKQPDYYLNRLKQFKAICTPDFSTYTDFPKVIQLYNHYRKHWLGAYWQMHGMTVIPTISWSDVSSFEWCFDGEPEGSIVAVSSVGTQVNDASKELFRIGYREMVERLQPSAVLFQGRVPDGCDGPEIIPIRTFLSGLKQRTNSESREER